MGKGRWNVRELTCVLLADGYLILVRQSQDDGMTILPLNLLLEPVVERFLFYFSWGHTVLGCSLWLVLTIVSNLCLSCIPSDNKSGSHYWMLFQTKNNFMHREKTEEVLFLKPRPTKGQSITVSKKLRVIETLRCIILADLVIISGLQTCNLVGREYLQDHLHEWVPNDSWPRDWLDLEESSSCK